MLFHDADKLRQEHRLLLAVLASALGDLQGSQPEIGIIYHGHQCQAAKLYLTERLRARAKRILREIEELSNEQKPPKLMLNRHCQACEFRSHCRAEATRQDDLSLLRSMGENEIRAQNRRGIFTVTQLSYTFRPRKKSKRAKDQSLPHHHALQALAIREGKTYAFAKPTIPSRPTRIYLDIEGNTDATSVYLVGALVVEDGVEKQHTFWAEGAGEEERLLDQLLGIVEGKDYVLFHYGRYERDFLERVRQMARRKKPIDHVLANSVDVQAVIRSNIYFPTYSNSLKDIPTPNEFFPSEENTLGVRID